VTKRLPCPPAPARWRTTPPSSTRCSSGSRSAAALWLSARAAAGRDRNKTMTCLAGAEPIVGAQHAAVQGLQWFVSESTWDAEQVSQRRLELLWADPATAPHDRGALVVDDSGDGKAGTRPPTLPASTSARSPRPTTASWRSPACGPTSASTGPPTSCPTPRRPGSPRASVILGFGPSRSWPPTSSTPPTRPGSGSARWWPTAATATTPASPRLGRAGVAYVLAVKPPRGSGRRPVRPYPARGGRRARLGGPEHPGDWAPITRRFRDGHLETWWAADARLPAAGWGLPGGCGWWWRPPTRQAAEVDHLVAAHQPAPPRPPTDTPAVPAGRPGRGRRPVRPAQLGRAGLQAGQERARLGRLPGPLGPRDPAALAAGVLRVLVLLAGMVCRAPCPTGTRRPADRPTGAARGETAGPPNQPNPSDRPVAERAALGAGLASPVEHAAALLASVVARAPAVGAAAAT